MPYLSLSPISVLSWVELVEVLPLGNWYLGWLTFSDLVLPVVFHNVNRETEEEASQKGVFTI